MANTRSNVYKPTARKSLRQNSPRVLLSNVYRLVRIDIPFPVQLQFALTDCSLPFKFLNVSLFFLSFFSRLVTTNLRDINHEFLVRDLHRPRWNYRIMWYVDRASHLIKLVFFHSLFYFTRTHTRTHDRLLSSSSNCALKIKLIFFTTFFTTFFPTIG